MAEVSQADVGVKGMGEAMKQAEAGMKLLMKEEVEIVTDKAAAQKFKDETDAKIKALEDAVAALTGKDNKKARTEKSKEAYHLKVSEEYIDAQKVLKGLPPPNGNFVLKDGRKEQDEKAKAAHAEAEKQAGAENGEADKKDDKKKDDKKPAKKTESAGISPAERQELERLKNDIITRKAELKAQGLSGGQMNKDEQVVAWVHRMNELKEKECPGSTSKDAKKDDKKGDGKKKLSKEAEAELRGLEEEVENYRQKLVSEFKYTKKEIAADPDMIELQAKLKKLQGKK